MDVLGNGVVKVKDIFTHILSLEEYGRALDTVSKPGKKIKVVIRVSQ